MLRNVDHTKILTINRVAACYAVHFRHLAVVHRTAWRKDKKCFKI